MMAEAMGVDIAGYMSDMRADRELASIEDAITQQVDALRALVDEFGIGYAVRRGESLSEQGDLLTCQTSGDYRTCDSREILRRL